MVPLRVLSRTLNDVSALAVALPDVKLYLRIGYDDEDDTVERLIRAATLQYERLSRLALLTQRIVCRARYAPGHRLWVPVAPAQSITSLVDGAGGAVPYTERDEWQAAKSVAVTGSPRPGSELTLTYQAGYGDSDIYVPDDSKAALLQMVQHFYDHRASFISSGAVPQPVPDQFRGLLEGAAYVPGVS